VCTPDSLVGCGGAGFKGPALDVIVVPGFVEVFVEGLEKLIQVFERAGSAYEGFEVGGEFAYIDEVLI
jgi:hypothetical protein